MTSADLSPPLSQTAQFFVCEYAPPGNVAGQFESVLFQCRFVSWPDFLPVASLLQHQRRDPCLKALVYSSLYFAFTLQICNPLLRSLAELARHLHFVFGLARFVFLPLALSLHTGCGLLQYYIVDRSEAGRERVAGRER
jgi:hypothetical protein